MDTIITRGRGRPAKYPFSTIPVGGTFFAPQPPDSFRACAYSYAKRHGLTFKTRGVVDNNTYGVQVVRTS